MQGSIQPLIQFYDSNERVLAIPVYQRNYDWKQENCARLFDDLVETMSSSRDNHFFGSIVYSPESLGTFTIIDGQQRLTTVNLLFLALWRSLQNGMIEVDGDPEELADRIYDSYLCSKYAKGGFSNKKLKLKPVKADQQAYEKLFGDEENFDEDSNITANFRYFMNRIEREKELSADDLFEAIRRLQVMRLELDKGDDAQLIFESLNSTGLDLSEADLIRNYVLMGHDSATQERLYENYWNRIETLVDYRTSEFIRAYLTSQLGRFPREKDVYAEFKTFHRRGRFSIEELLAELLEFANYHHQLETATTGVGLANRILNRFNLLDRTVAMPFLMLVLRDLHLKKLNEDQFCRILRITDTYLTRRWVCGYPTNALNKIFALLYREVVKLLDGDADFVGAMTYQLLQRTGSGTFPEDVEFSESLLTKDFYKVSASQRNYFWESMENGESRDIRDIANALSRGDISVEHIMPQKLSREWVNALGSDASRIHETWLNRLGNLTVTGYNSSYSNRSFAEKRDHEQGFAASPYRLNRLLRDAESWGEEEITRRTIALRDEALQIWPMPVIDFQPKAEVGDVQPMGDDRDFTGRRITRWEFKDDKEQVNAWKKMLIGVTQMLTGTHRAEVFRYAQHNNGLQLTNPGEPIDRNYTEVIPGLSVWTECDTASKMWLLRGLFAELGLDPEELVFHLVPTDNDEVDEEDADTD